MGVVGDDGLWMGLVGALVASLMFLFKTSLRLSQGKMLPY
jgi:hypothetical protein